MNQPADILVVEDSQTQLHVLRDTLEQAGYSVDTARNGVEAMGRIHQQPPRLVLSDILMPELNGYHLCRLLKTDTATSHIPVVLLTNLNEQHDRFWGTNAGADAFLEKSLDLKPLLDTITRLLKSSPPLAAPPNGAAEPAAPSSTDIQDRINQTLDRLLYESTISQEVLKLTALAHDSAQLAQTFLQFLRGLCSYRLAGLLLREGRDKYLLCWSAPEPLAAASREQAMRTVQEQFAPLGLGQAALRTLCSDGEPQPCEAEPLQLIVAEPVRDDGDLLAGLVLFSSGARTMSDGMRQALGVVLDRLLIVARYLKKVQEIEEVKADFVSMLVHDLRSPLTSVKGFSEVLTAGLLGQVNQEQQDAFENIQNGCDRMLGLIENILDLSKLEAGKLKIHPGPLDLRLLLERSCAQLAPLARGKGVALTPQLPAELPCVLADGQQIARVLSNLLSNAIEFTPSGGRVTLSAAPAAPDGELQIDVSDTGCGIPAAQQQRLFQRYQQAGGGSMFRKGTGLGLAICQEIVQLHGGRIWIDSPLDNDRGSRFSFTLPLI